MNIVTSWLIGGAVGFLLLAAAWAVGGRLAATGSYTARAAPTAVAFNLRTAVVCAVAAVIAALL